MKKKRNRYGYVFLRAAERYGVLKRSRMARAVSCME